MLFEIAVFHLDTALFHSLSYMIVIRKFNATAESSARDESTEIDWMPESLAVHVVYKVCMSMESCRKLSTMSSLDHRNDKNIYRKLMIRRLRVVAFSICNYWILTTA